MSRAPARGASTAARCGLWATNRRRRICRNSVGDDDSSRSQSIAAQAGAAAGGTKAGAAGDTAAGRGRAKTADASWTYHEKVSVRVEAVGSMGLNLEARSQLGRKYLTSIAPGGTAATSPGFAALQRYYDSKTGVVLENTRLNLTEVSNQTVSGTTFNDTLQLLRTLPRPISLTFQPAVKVIAPPITNPKIGAVAVGRPELKRVQKETESKKEGFFAQKKQQFVESVARMAAEDKEREHLSKEPEPEAPLGDGASVYAVRNFVPAASAKICPRCSKSFGLLRRKYHCGGCGAVICDGCSQQRLEVRPGGSEVRVCDGCPNPELVAQRDAAEAAAQAAAAAEEQRVRAEEEAAQRKTRVFISYAVDAAPLADALVAFLESNELTAVRRGDPGITVAASSTFLYIVSPQWLEDLKQAADTACCSELALALAAHGDPTLMTALVPVLHADCGGVFPSAHIPDIDGSLRQAFSFTFVLHMTATRHYSVFLEELLERINAVAPEGDFRRKVFLSHKQLDSQELVRVIALYLDRLGIPYFLDVDHLLANHDSKALTASCEYFLYVMSKEWLKDVQLPLPDSAEQEQHKADYANDDGQFEGEHWKGRHASWCRQELATALEVHATDLSRLVPVKHKSFSDDRAAQVPQSLAVAMQLEAVEHHVGGKHFVAFIEELLERMGIKDFSKLHGVAEAGGTGSRVPMIPLDEVALLTSEVLDGAAGGGSTDSRARLEAENQALKAQTAALMAKAAEAKSLEAQLKKNREKLALLAKNSKLDEEASETGGGGGGGQAQLQMSAASSAEERLAASAAKVKELERKIAEQDVALASMAPSAAAAVSAGLASPNEDGPTERTAEQAGQLMPSGERLELEREIKELLAEHPSRTLSLGGKVLVEMTDEELRGELTILHAALEATVDIT
eukprot:SAG11_NODE_629_length_8073_cov_6.782042_3_plen_911_part_00